MIRALRILFFFLVCFLHFPLMFSQEDGSKEIGIGGTISPLPKDSSKSCIHADYKRYISDWSYVAGKMEFWFLPHGKASPLLVGIGINYIFQYSLFAGIYPTFKMAETHIGVGINPCVSERISLDDHFNVNLNASYHYLFYSGEKRSYLDIGIGMSYNFE